MKKEQINRICAGGLLAALYIVTTAINPIGYGIIQLRISAIISIIPFFREEYKFPCIAAVAIANIFSPLGFIDVLVGVTLWSIAYYGISKLTRNIYARCGLTAILSGLLVGSELSYTLHVPFLFNFASVTVSQGIVFSIGIVILQYLNKVFSHKK